MYLLRKLIYVFGLAALMAAQQGHALGLGESDLHSALNQPLRADIRLNNLRDLEEDDIIIRMASNADFERAGVERLEFYDQLEFELILDHETGPLVRVTTQGPVREPYLNFLVEARWATGRLLREYTFLLDLPVYDDDRGTQPVEAAGGESAPQADWQAPEEQRQPARETASEPEQAPGQTRAFDTYGPVGENDTLWEIALRARPGRDVSVQQTMLAIQRQNPEAFIDGNINLLREGQVLRLPNREEIQGLSQRDAVAEVENHNRQWSERTMGAQLDAGQRQQTAERQNGEPSGQVRLAAADEAGTGESGQGAGTGTEGGTELSAELAATQEELDRSRRENRELSSRVEELEAQIETMESLVEASNEQLRALQMAAEESRRSEEQGADPEAMDDPEATVEGEVVPSAEEDEPAATEEEQAGEAQAEAEREAEEAAAAAGENDRGRRVISSAPQETLMARLLDNLMYIGLGLGAILLAAYGLLRRRSQAEAPEEEVALDEFDPDFELEDFQAGEEFESPDDYQDDSEFSGEETEYDFGAWEEDESVPLEAETDDVVGEAEIYIAYGNLDQAQELLSNGLEKEPGSAAILSKLLEVYADKRDVAAFDEHYVRLLETGDRSAVERAGELRDTIPGAGEFELAASPASAQSDEALGQGADSQPESDSADDLGFNFDLGEAGDSSESGGDLSLDDDFHFDLDEDEEFEESPLLSEAELESSSNRYDLSFSEEEAGEVIAEEDEFALDLDLDEDGPEGQEDEGLMSLQSDEDFPELDLKPDQSTELETAESTDLGTDDWNFDLDTAEPGDLSNLDEELSTLDEILPEADQEPSAALNEEPSAGSNEEPSAGLSEEPLAEFNEEPLADGEPLADEEPSAEVNEEPSAEINEEPSAEINEERPADVNEDPSADLNEELLADLNEADFAAAPSTRAEDSEFSLDDMIMDDLDLSSFDEEMNGLDADLEGAEFSTDVPSEGESGSVQEEAGFDEVAPSSTASEVAEPDQASSEAEQPSEDEQPSEEEMDAELDFLADTDEAATKLDLARAYIDMGDSDGARDILEEVSQEGDDEQKQEAAELLDRIES